MRIQVENQGWLRSILIADRMWKCFRWNRSKKRLPTSFRLPSRSGATIVIRRRSIVCARARTASAYSLPFFFNPVYEASMLRLRIADVLNLRTLCNVKPVIFHPKALAFI